MVDFEGWQEAATEVCCGIDDAAQWAWGELPPGALQQELRDLSTAYLALQAKVMGLRARQEIAVQRAAAVAYYAEGLG